MARYLPEAVPDLGGRPSRLTDDLAARIADEVRMGATPRRAAAICGIPRKTWESWVTKHGKGQEPYKSRMEVIAMAQASWEAVAEQGIAASGKWEGLAWLLKTRNRAEYGDKVQVDNARSALEALDDAALEAIALAAPPARG